MKARMKAHCQACGTGVKAGQEIRKSEHLGWVHSSCFDSIRNAVLVNHGHTFAGTPRQYRRRQKRID